MIAGCPIGKTGRKEYQMTAKELYNFLVERGMEDEEMFIQEGVGPWEEITKEMLEDYFDAVVIVKEKNK